MKIATYERSNAFGKFKRLGVFFNTSTIVDVNFCWQAHFEQTDFYTAPKKAFYEAPNSLWEILNCKSNAIAFFQDTLQHYDVLSQLGVLKTRDGADIAFDLKDDKNSKLLCPLDKINSFRDFYTFEDHVKKGFEKRGEPVPEEWYQIPVYYKSLTQNMMGDGDIIPWPSFTKKLDYELELGAVIGSYGKNLKGASSLKHIFGFTVINDVSARDLQRQEMKVRLGPSKSKDFCTVVGPVITTMDEFKFSNPDLAMTAKINGNIWSQGRSSQMHHDWTKILEFLTWDEAILPGDLLGSGTVGTGCGLELDQWIKPSDVVECEIEHIGRIKNVVGIPNT
ncbi:MAG: fumarylacetoacetate hydrolase family protein [Bacteriovoracaceae bacterium]|nr:fumarylacetoacetate hydrolase family protein [Bacteriovoracaceae bacterium]